MRDCPRHTECDLGDRPRREQNLMARCMWSSSAWDQVPGPRPFHHKCLVSRWYLSFEVFEPQTASNTTGLSFMRGDMATFGSTSSRGMPTMPALRRVGPVDLDEEAIVERNHFAQAQRGGAGVSSPHSAADQRLGTRRGTKMCRRRVSVAAALAGRARWQRQDPSRCATVARVDVPPRVGGALWFFCPEWCARDLHIRAKKEAGRELRSVSLCTG